MSRRRVPIRQSELVQRFAERLREIRLSRGMTQADLSKVGDVTASYLSRLEAGKVAPGIDMVERLALVLGASPAELLPTTTPPDALPILKDQAKQLLDVLLQKADSEIFLRLNPFLALLVEASSKRGDKLPHVVRGNSRKREFVSDVADTENEDGSITRKTTLSERIELAVRTVDLTGQIRTFMDTEAQE